MSAFEVEVRERIKIKSDRVLHFDSTIDAKEFLRNNGFEDYSDEDLEDSFYFQESEV